MDKKITKFLKITDSTLEILYKKIDDWMNKICEEKYYGFEPEDDKEYFTLEEIKYGIIGIREQLLKLKEQLKND